ncbi:hypothetical protein [Ruegeria arenilitoris]|uniref:hypothetical protein n=1 Tax=Ruegeria arenilitoris TaxID=1173585 RepID=UPI00147DAF7E|nr:hypothetical protein [Ruegeria arenilitoris]
MSKNKDTGEKPGKNKKNTSLRLDGKTLKALKIRAIEEGTSVQKIIETLVNDYLDTPKKGRS